MKRPTAEGVERRMNPLPGRTGGYDPRKKGRRIPGGSSLDHLSLARFSRVCLYIILLAGGGAVLAALLQAQGLVGPGTAETIKWVAIGLALLLFFGDGLRRFTRSRPGQKVSRGESSRSGGAASSSRPEEGSRRQK